MSEPTRSTIDTIDVPLAGGRVLRVALHTDADGRGGLVIAAGFLDRGGWRRLMADGVSLPAGAAPDLVRAIELVACRREVDGD